jgi:hypothetical protein
VVSGRARNCWAVVDKDHFIRRAERVECGIQTGEECGEPFFFVVYRDHDR